MTYNIDVINGWVAAYKRQRDQQAIINLLEQFMPLMLKYSKMYFEQYAGVHEWDHVVHEAQVIFCELIEEYTIGGPAYFTVFVERKLPFRLRYFFVKEIRRRTTQLSHNREQFEGMGLTEDGDIFDDIILRERADAVWVVLQDRTVISEREFELVVHYFWGRCSHREIADMYGISRPRVTQIINIALQKIKEALEGKIDE